MRKLFSFLWNNSPKHVLQTLKARLAGGSGHRQGGVTNQRYHNDLLELFWEFINTTFPEKSLSKHEFIKLILKYQSGNVIGSNNIYFGDLWYLFAPDYRNKLQEYYTYMQYHSTMRFLEYSANPAFIDGCYVHPYQIARERLGKMAVLEVGGGIPHGLLNMILYQDSGFCSEFTLVEISAVYTQFVDWFCRQQAIPFTLVTTTAGKTAVLPEHSKYDFIFAKDVFEHLHRPREMLEQILLVASTRAILALDLEDRGDVVYQHISPHLSPLKDVLHEKGFIDFEKSEHITLFHRS